MKTIAERLVFDPARDLLRLFTAYAEGRVPVFPAGMEGHFRLAKLKPERFRSHPPVLALSLGGTNTKLMIAAMNEGHLVVDYVRTLANPNKPTFYHDYFDELLLHDETVRNFLQRQSRPCLGIALPVVIVDGVPYHKIKVPNLVGLIARDLERDAPTHEFAPNFQAYLASRGLPPAKLFFQTDGIVAHHGAVSLCELAPEDKSVLLVCGTGLATGDEESDIPIGMTEILDEDEELYPAALTEGHQYQYAVAGKGLYGLMARAVRLKAREEGSLLRDFDPEPFFSLPEDSRTVVEIWESSLPEGTLRGNAQRIAELIGRQAFAELQFLAGRIMDRAIASMANCTVATIVQMGPAASGRGHTVFFEGSLARNEFVLPRLKAEISARITAKELFEQAGVTAPLKPEMDRPLRPFVAGSGLSTAELAKVDLTLVGAATAAVAEDIRTMDAAFGSG